MKPQDYINKCHFGDCRDVLRQMIADGVRVNMCVTSPPYFNLRDYGTATWEVGDSGCDHTVIRRNHGEHEKQATSAGTSRDPITVISIARSYVIRRVFNHFQGVNR